LHKCSENNGIQEQLTKGKACVPAPNNHHQFVFHFKKKKSSIRLPAATAV
jgi:hypothetical protein